MGSRDHLFKVLVVGDAAVGKTSLVQRYSQDSFSKHYKSTVGGERPRGSRRRGLQPVVAGYWGQLWGREVPNLRRLPAKIRPKRTGGRWRRWRGLNRAVHGSQLYSPAAVSFSNQRRQLSPGSSAGWGGLLCYSPAWDCVEERTTWAKEQSPEVRQSEGPDMGKIGEQILVRTDEPCGLL